MSYSFIERKRIRKNFSQKNRVLPVDNLLAGQFDSFRECLQAEIPHSKRKDIGVAAVLKSIKSIKSKAKVPLAELHFDSYSFKEPTFTVEDCKLWGTTYSMPLHVKTRLITYEKLEKAPKNDKNTKVKEIKEEEVFLGEIPCMTPRGSFLINGTERVVVSQLRRSPGVIFDSDKGKTSPTGKILYKARLIPHRGEWLDFEFDLRDHIYFRIDRKRKLPVTVMLRAMGYDSEAILKEFYSFNTFDVKAKSLDLKLSDLEQFEQTQAKFDISDKEGQVLVSKGSRITRGIIKKIKENGIKKLNVDYDYLIGEVLATNVPDQFGEIIPANQVIDEKILERIKTTGEKQLQTLRINNISLGSYISDTLRLEETQAEKSKIELNKDHALTVICQILRPGEPIDTRQAEDLFRETFFTDNRFDLSSVGRMKINLRLGLDIPSETLHLKDADILAALRTLVEVRNGLQASDDVDHLGNRRVRTISEMIAEQFRLGMLRVVKVVSERLANIEEETAKDLVNPKPVTSALREFFGGNRLSQFMDQTNPLSEIAHKRKLSALGPSGLTRERAGYEVRDVHSTHYGRLCPIESPEGQNIGLISSVACYAKVNAHGFLETPFFKVSKGKISTDLDYVSPLEERDKIIAQISTKFDDDGVILDERVLCRKNGEFGTYEPKEVHYMDVSPQQITSVASALIPFLEHNAANRALMGANMQRQAVPLLQAEKPLVGTGMERRVAQDSFSCAIARNDGVVEQAESNLIVIRNLDEEEESKGSSHQNELGVEIYPLEKFNRTNQDTCVNQTPRVRIGDRVKKGDIIADGSSIDMGELAVGKNVRVAFMMWNGENFEDSIIISERLLRNDTFTSIHIKELTCTARDTRNGPEEITADIPSANEAHISHIDESGIVNLGANVKAGDVLVGRISPKNEVQPTPEERLLKAIFGEKAGHVKDISQKVPNGSDGTVIDVQIMTHPSMEKDDRTSAVEKMQVGKRQRSYEQADQIRKNFVKLRVVNLLTGKKIKAGALKGKKVATKKELDALSLTDLFALKTDKDDVNNLSEGLKKRLKSVSTEAKRNYDKSIERIQVNSEIPSGVKKIVKVKLAVRRRIQPGDKMSGRYGNKGVISRVLPIEDMPFDENGEPVDIILNPLGLPSRMNIGQILETNLGWASVALGKQIGQLIDQASKPAVIRKQLEMLYNKTSGKSEDLTELNDEQIIELAENLRDGFPFASPIFDGASEKDVQQILKLAGCESDGLIPLYDGRTGNKFDQKVTVGYKYMMKLDHLVEDKMHARSTGSYSLVTQQPLGGKANKGGQRLGEMEVWALEAYGAAHTLREMLTVKSDDISGRKQAYRNIMLNDLRIEPTTPESFNVLVNEIRALGIDLEQVYEEPNRKSSNPTIDID